jgi:hypothetical protein
MSQTDTQAATRLPVLYRSITPVNRVTHKDLKLKALPEPLSFTRGTHLMPALAEEFAIAARELPIVFLPEGDIISPVFMLGLRSGHNSFVTPEGLWTSSYMPAYVRRYPFVLGDVEGSDPMLCMDEKFAGFNTKEGEPLFKPDGSPTPALEAAMKFAGEFRESGMRTIAFVDKLKSLDLFKSVTIDVKSQKLGPVSINGVLVVDEEKLKALPDATMLDLQKTGSLQAIYAHLMSLPGIPALG